MKNDTRDHKPGEVPDFLMTSWLCTALMRVGTRMATIFDQHFAEHHMTQAQFRVLLAVKDGGPTGIAPSMLADALLIERATISVLTSRLVERGLLTRQPGENRRTFNLALTDEGLRLLYQIIPAAVTLADQTLDGFTDTHLQEMRGLLETLEERLRTADSKKHTKDNTGEDNR